MNILNPGLLNRGIFYEKILITSAVLSTILLQPIVHADDGFVKIM